MNIQRALGLSQSSLILIASILVVLVIIFITRRKKEKFSFGSIFDKIKDVAVTVGKTTAGVATGVINKVTGGGYKPTWAYRTWNGRTWECPPGSIDYGREDDKQCLTSANGPEVWRPDASGNWGWSCPNGTTPNNSNDGNQKCIAGYSGKVLVDGQWRCTDTETDTGRNWDNSDWFTAQQQCKRGDTVYTYRMNVGGEWKCPPGTTDTGYSWSDGDNGGKQCQYKAW